MAIFRKRKEIQTCGLRHSHFLVLLRNTEFYHARTEEHSIFCKFSKVRVLKNFTRFRTFPWRCLEKRKEKTGLRLAPFLIFSSCYVIQNFLTPVFKNLFFRKFSKGWGTKNFTRLRTFPWRYLENGKIYRPAACAILIFSSCYVILNFFTPRAEQSIFCKFSKVRVLKISHDSEC